MKLKKFTAPTMPEVMQHIRSELGRDAVILQSKEVKKGGVFGFFQRKHMEVVAALDPEPVSKSSKASYNPPSMNDHVRAKELQESADQRNFDDSTILTEIQAMKKMLERTSRSTPSIPASLGKEYAVPYIYLTDQEVEASIAEDIVLHVQQEQQNKEQVPTDVQVRKVMEKEIVNLLTEEPLTQQLFDEHIIHFIGPTGVGKTTTLAKIAAKALLERKKSVAFITTDTYRIAAIEQLKTYARILEVPVEVAYSKEEYIAAIEKFSDYDQIYVDTAGRNYRDQSFVKELTEMIDGSKGEQATMLVLSLSSKSSDIQSIYEQFKHMENQHIIFSKVDETRQYGSILNIALQKHNPIAFMTNGQDVPDDIIEVHPQMVASYIMSEYIDA